MQRTWRQQSMRTFLRVCKAVHKIRQEYMQELCSRKYGSTSPAPLRAFFGCCLASILEVFARTAIKRCPIPGQQLMLPLPRLCYQPRMLTGSGLAQVKPCKKTRQQTTSPAPVSALCHEESQVKFEEPKRVEHVRTFIHGHAYSNVAAVQCKTTAVCSAEYIAEAEAALEDRA